MRRSRIVVGVVMMASLFGCGGEGAGDDAPDAQRTAEKTRTAASTTFEAIGQGVEALGYTSTGAGRWAICGQEPSPNGAQYVAEIAVTQSNVPPSKYGAVVREQAEAQGWSVEEAGADTLEGRKDGLTLRAQYGAAGMNLSVRSRCLDVPKDEIRRLTDQPKDDLGVAPPS
ncbi:hypothetical protein QE370_002836 [Aeromicrobium sp. SORGH_AS981]|uniref:hypothetical protein n=1 Tax=Aeromicrobium sp. SORGH_AS_0981 TaxID=3041802 RepID=UPI00285E28CC|nr:hypothetical protein [Aeromicrobium sp. SORGH_AS_0981]MDR6119652.1 hypothetical protein [Aeromicrobium sp. SORGH_AS_0981]